MDNLDLEMLPPTPGARLGKFFKREDVRKALLWGVFYTIVFIILGRVAYPHWMPKVLSKQMQSEEDIMIWFTAISAPVAGVVLGVATQTFVNMHRGDTPPEDGVAIRTNTPIIIAWSAVSVALTTVAIVWGLVALNTDAFAAAKDATKSLVVDVTGSQWAWSFYYPEQNIHTHTLNIPVDRPVTFNVVSVDVNHSFWPVQLGVKVDANRLVKTVAEADPSATGPLDVKCAELCGLYHAYMETTGAVQTPSDFSRWVSSIQATGGIQE